MVLFLTTKGLLDMGHETWEKKEREKKKRQKLKKKEEKKQSRKENNDKGKDLTQMMAYLDEDGNLSSTPPDPRKKKKEILADQIQLNPPRSIEQVVIDRTGAVKEYFTAKGYGFITDSLTKEDVFFHQTDLIEAIIVGAKVSFTMLRNQKGLSATQIKKVQE